MGHLARRWVAWMGGRGGEEREEVALLEQGEGVMEVWRLEGRWAVGADREGDARAVCAPSAYQGWQGVWSAPR